MMAENVTGYYQEPNRYVFIRQFEDVKEYPFSDSLFLVAGIVIAYLYFVLIIGPRFMKDREPYKLKYTVLTYNVFQVILSAYFMYRSYEIMRIAGFLPQPCLDYHPKIREKMSHCAYVYWLGKITELLDTIFFVLRKKFNQVTFLHVYHHATMAFFMYPIFLYVQGFSTNFLIFFNAFVHVVMYTYYALSGLGPEVAKYLTWKKHITNFQRVQFVCILIYLTYDFFFIKCDHSVFGFIYMWCTLMFFLYLFTKFYNESYKKADRRTPVKEN